MTDSAAISAMTEGEKVIARKVENAGMTRDEQIRAKALECGTRLCERCFQEIAVSASVDEANDILWAVIQDFERYIREGK